MFSMGSKSPLVGNEPKNEWFFTASSSHRKLLNVQTDNGHVIARTSHSPKMDKTIIVTHNHLHFVKYQSYERRQSSIPAHVSPCSRLKQGDHVIITSAGHCQKL